MISLIKEIWLKLKRGMTSKKLNDLTILEICASHDCENCPLCKKSTLTCMAGKEATK